MAELLQNFEALDWLALGAGAALGVAILFLIMARQVWAYRQFFGYDVYSADARQARLVRRSLFAFIVAMGAGGLFVAKTLQGADTAPSVSSSAASAVTTPAADPLEGMLLVIPRIGIETDIIHARIIGNHWDISELTTQAAHLEGTALPGQPGNAVLAGHITVPDAGWGPFHELENLQIGDEVGILAADNRIIIYKVAEILTVAPTEIRIALPFDDMRLTLLTCSDWDDSRKEYMSRLVIVAIHTP